nr:hypothetical protein [Tanacetum cinerariifolium]
MAALRYRDEHNKVGYLLKPIGSDDYHQIIDFLRASHIRSPELGPPAIQATIDETPYTITEDLVRSQLQSADECGIDDLLIAKIYSGMDNLGLNFEGHPMPLLTAMLSQDQEGEGVGVAAQAVPQHMHAPDQPQDHLSTPQDNKLLTLLLQFLNKPLGGSFHMSSPRSTQAPPAGQTSGSAENLITLTALSSVVSTLMQKVKAMEVKLRTSKRKMVVSDSDQEEGGKQDVNLNALLSLANAAVIVDSNISPGGASDNLATSTSVHHDMQEDRLGEQAAKRLHDEEQAQVDRQRAELQRKRQQEVLPSAMYYTKADWINIMAQVKANASLSKTLLDNFLARMAALIKRKKQALVEKLAKERKDRPMTQGQQKTYMRQFVRNQSCVVYSTGWSMAYVKSFNDDQLKEEFELIQKALSNIQIHAFNRTLKRTGPVLEEPSSKRQKSTEAPIPSMPEVPPSPVVSSPKSSGTRRKSLGRNRLSKPKFKLKELDLDADAQTFIKVVSNEDFEDEATRLWSALVGWEVILTPLGDINALYRIDRSTAYFTTLREILHMVDRQDLLTLYGLVVKYYANHPVAGDGLIFVHVLETVSGEVVYMFVDVPYPLSVKLMERMLTNKLEIDKDVVGNDMTTVEQLFRFIKNQLAVAQSLTYLIKDCDYYEKKMAQTPARNHAQRGNHQKYARMTHPNPQRHVVPTAVLTKSKLVPLTAARPVTTAVPQPHVTRPRPAKTIVTKPHSPPIRNINRRPSPKASTFPLKVTTAKAPMGNPQHALKDKWVIDSGCSRHMTGNMSYLSDIKEINGGYVAFGGNPKGGKITRKSVSQMCNKKNIILFTNTECIVLSPKFKLPDENQVLLRVPRENNMYNVDLKNIIPFRDLTCLFAKAILDESNLWHRKLGHINFKKMNKLVKGNLVRGLPSKVFENNHTCVSCKKGKQHRASCKTKPVSSVSQPLQRIKREFSVPRTPQQNGIAKRKNRTLIEAARTMLADSLLPILFWVEAFNTACYVQNRVLVSKHHNKTPYELLLGRTPSIGFMRPFDCPVTILNTLDPLGKFDGKVDVGFLVAYSVSSKAFRVFNSRTRIIQENLHINFLENEPNVVGSGPTWLFDIDTLTKSMNYQPVTAGNQSNPSACVQKQFDVEKVREDNVQQYVLFPLWSSGSQHPQNIDGDAAFRVKEPEFEGRKPDINEVIDAGTHVPAVGQISTNSTNTFSAVGPSNTAVSPTHGKSLYMDSSQYPDDPNMPAFPIPTTRAHKDHPVTQIIGNLSSATQTRSMIRVVKDQVDLPNGKRAIGTKWGFRNKKDERGIVVSNIAQLVAQGYTQDEGIDYEEVFAPVARVETIRLFLAYASFMGFMVYQMNVKSAFLYETIEEEVYVCQPPGFEDPDYPDKVYKVVKALYGLHQSPRAWYETLTNYLLENGFQKGKIDQTLFIKKQKGDILLVQVYVDDIIFGSTNKDLCKAFEKLMKDKFQMISMGELTFFLGLQVKQKQDGIFISQDKFVAEILRKFGLTNGKSASTPIDTEKPLLKDLDGEDVDVHTYRSMIGSLMYLTSSRPDIMFVVCAYAHFQVTPKVLHLHAVKRIFRYLKGKPHLGLWYPKDSPFNLVSYSDIDYAGASLDRKSTTGGCQFLRCRLISWQCKKQTVVATSSTEAEYVAAASCCAQVLWIHNQLLDYGPDQMISGKDSSNPLMADNLLKIVWYSTHRVALMKS